MRARFLVAACLLTAATLTGTIGDGRAAAAPVRQQSVAYLSEPTLIGSTFVQGPVLFVHDTVKMAKGEPCTKVYLYDPAGHRETEEIASFHCMPRDASIVTRFTVTTRPSTLGYGCVLTSYQFPRDPEVHGVPQPADAH